MFDGVRINRTEDRAVLHTALRAPADRHLVVDGHDVVPDVHEVLDRMGAFALKVRLGEWKGFTGKPVRNVVNIGIGGSDLGPAMATEALRNYADRSMRFRFVSNIDGTDIRDATLDLDPAETLFVVSSKTFTTLETLTNARTARDWLVAGLGDDRRRRAPLRRGVDQRRQGPRVRHRHGEHVRVLGLGGRPVLDGQRHRPVADAGHRAGRLRRAAGRLPRDGRALPARAARAEPARPDGAAWDLVRQRVRVRDPRGPARTPRSSPGSPPTSSSWTWSPTASPCASTAPG